MSQLNLNFEAIFNNEARNGEVGLDRQIEQVLDQLGFGERGWTEEVDSRFVFWLHIHVLQDTVNVISDSRSGKVLKREAAEWLFSEATGGFSFFSIARILGAEPGELLAKILEMPKVRNGLSGIIH